MAENPFLPDEILVEIFSRLPTRSVGRCMCLSTRWRSQLSKPQFLDLHFTRKPHQQNLFLIAADYIKDYPVYDIPVDLEDSDRFILTMALPITEESVLKKLNVPEDYWVELVGSVNGLVLLHDRLNDMCLMNPVTREQVIIPRPYFNRFGGLFGKETHGFGYDCSSDDYKIVSLGFIHIPIPGGNDDDEEVSNYGVSVYSVKKGVWIRKDIFPKTCIFGHKAYGALLNGAIHWLAKDEQSKSLVILAFDLDSEEIRQVPTPVSASNYSYGDAFAFYSAPNLGGCLCIMEPMCRWWPRDGKVIDIWMMKEYGIQESWVKFTIQVVNMPGVQYLAWPLCYIGEDEVLLVDQNTTLLFVSNVTEKTQKVVLGNRGVAVGGCVYVESLVSPKQLASLDIDTRDGSLGEEMDDGSLAGLDDFHLGEGRINWSIYSEVLKEMDDGGLGEETDDGSSDEEMNDGSSGEEMDDGSSGEEMDDGSSGEETDDGSSGEETDDGSSGEEMDDGSLAEENEEMDYGSSREETDDGSLGEETDDGSSGEDMGDGSLGEENEETNDGL